MAKMDLQYDLVNYTPASASPVEANFNRVEQYVNQELIERDGTVAMRAQLRLVGDPLSPLDAAPKQYVDQVLPVGIVMMYGGVGVPPGGRWAICNGAELESATYSALFAVIGNNFSPAGTPAGRFHLPNVADRVVMGVGSTTALGATGGSKDSTLVGHDHDLSTTTGGQSSNHDHAYSGTTVQAPPHHHAPNGGGLFVVQRGDAVVSLTYPGLGLGFVSPDTTSDNGEHDHFYSGTTFGANQNHDHPVTGTTEFVGGTGVDTNLPPYIGLPYIMRVL